MVSHDRNLNRTAPSHLSGLAVANTYSQLKVITTQLADFIRGLGYDAMYRETLGWTPEMLMVPMAIDAGIGELGRTGRVLSPKFRDQHAFESGPHGLTARGRQTHLFRSGGILYGVREVRCLLSDSGCPLRTSERAASRNVLQHRGQEMVCPSRSLSHVLGSQ